jgi:hypothetical protein
MPSTNLDQFELIALGLMRIACWPIQKEGEKGELNIMWVCGGGTRGENGTLCSIYEILPSETSSLEHECRIHRVIPVYLERSPSRE